MLPIEKDAYLIHYQSQRMVKRIKEAQLCIEDFLSLYPKVSGSVSFGKDSIVMMHLIHSIAPHIPFIWADRCEGGDIPEVYDLAKEYQIRGYDIITVKTPFSILELWSKYTIDDLLKRKIITKQLKETLRKAGEDYDGFFWGLRAQESKGRRRFALCHGDIFERKDGKATCSPVLFWSARDIWGYIVGVDTPYNPYYDLVSLKPFDREETRYSNWAGICSLSQGRHSDIKRVFPSFFAQLAAIEPKVRTYV